jgi:hypothetical protein
MVECICKICERKFNAPPSDIKNGGGKYCSRKCMGIAQRKYNDIEIKENHAEIIIKSPKFGEHRALIDLDDVEKCKEYTWTLNYVKALNDFYVFTTKPLQKKIQCGNTRQEHIKLHRFITNCPEDKVVDHINHNCLDNRKENLKVCTQFENIKNNKNNKSGYSGVFWDKDRQKWQVRINYQYKGIFLGRYDKIEDAIQARKQAEQKYFGA